MFARIFIAHIMGSVDFVTTIKPVAIIAKPTNIAAEIAKATITEGMFGFNVTWNI